MDVFGSLKLASEGKALLERLPEILDKWTEFLRAGDERTKNIERLCTSIDARMRGDYIDPALEREVMRNAANDPRSDLWKAARPLGEIDPHERMENGRAPERSDR